MLKTERMSNVIITGPKPLQLDVVKKLHELKILHIMEHEKNEFADTGFPLKSAEKLSENLILVRALISKLGIKNDLIKEQKTNIEEVEKNAKKLNEKLNSLSEQDKKAQESLTEYNNTINELEILKDIPINLESLGQYKTLSYFTGFFRKEEELNLFREEITNRTDRFEIFNAIYKNKIFAIIFVQSIHKDSVNNLLGKFSFSSITLSKIFNLKGNPYENYEKFSETKKSLEVLKEKIKSEIGNMASDFKWMLLNSERFLLKELSIAEAPLKFASTGHAFIIKGFVPTESLKESIEQINNAGKGKIYIKFDDAKNSDKVPVKLKNYKIVKPFEFLLNLYTLPSYKEIDPSAIIFFTFPILFGFMLGDIGYGFTTLILFYALRRKFPSGKQLFDILIFSSIATIFFGFLFGEFFGFEKIFGNELPHLLSRSHQYATLLIFSVVVGIIHLNLGLIIGFINELHHGFVKAFNEKISWIILQIGVFLFLIWLIKKSISLYTWPIVITIAVLLIWSGEGIKGLIELPAIFSNILSYARLMALGLASVKLAEVINHFSGEFFHFGGIYIVFAILLLIVGHAINLALGLLGPFLHSLRLHYVEFFAKFFHGQGQKYKPFGESF